MRISRGTLTALALTALATAGPPAQAATGARTAATGSAAVTAAAVIHSQVITVRAATATARTAVLEAWQRTSTGAYRRVYGPITAYVGAGGVGTASEGSTRTPAGVWWLTQAFGIKANPGVTLRYFKVDNNDWWVSDVHSPYYNQHYRCAPGHCPFNEAAGEHLLAVGAAYRYAVLINYNTGPIRPGAGSAFFLHVSTGRPTAGCVAVPQANLLWLMRWMYSLHHPLISIGVGSQAYAPIPRRV
jgi:L,D-peptidoglycan transpeptidase YkuD (ErfK/YbiS/YcfS/YnhG family)